MKRGVATFTLDFGKCPAWLYRRMVTLGRQMAEVLVTEYGSAEFVKRIADPVWFQALGTVLAFDWNASGLTTILTAALKEAIRGQEKDLGIVICGGKGKTSRKTPDEIVDWSMRLGIDQAESKNLVYNSRMSAKVDSSLVQDDYQIYHHAFFFSVNSQKKINSWVVVQQGMNTKNVTARRYHWFSENIEDMVCEPHSGIASQLKVGTVLDLTSQKSGQTRKLSTNLSNSYKTLMGDIEIIKRHESDLSRMIGLRSKGEELTLVELSHGEFSHHPVELENFFDSPYLAKIFSKVSDLKPKTYEELLSLEGVGPKTMRALSLVSEIIYGAKPSYEDPARYSFAHGGKDGTPYPVDTKTYDETIEIMRRAVLKSKISQIEKDKAIKRLGA